MKFARKVIVGVNLSVDAHDEFIALKDLEFLNDCDIHFVHGFLTTTYAYGLGETALIYPLFDDRKKFEESIVSTLKGISEKIFKGNPRIKIHTHCLFSENPKKGFCEFVEKNHADLVILSAREKRGLFESSFTQYVERHTKANLLILKQKENG